MEQKTEASQAVDELERADFEAWHRSKFATRHSTGQPTRDMHNGIYAKEYGPEHQQKMWEAWQASRAALKAQPAPTEAPSAWMAESHVGNGVRAVTKFALDEATIDRYVSAEQASFAGCERTKIALYRRPAPTEALTLEDFPVLMKDHNVRQLVNDLRDIAIQFHGAGQLRARISGAVGQFLDAHGLPKAPTDAQPDRQALQAEGKHPAPCARHCEATAFGIEIRRLTAENAQLRAAQGEDSAWLDADMLALLIREAGIINARGIAWLLNGESISLNLTNLLAIANMIEDRASTETGGVSRADLGKLLSDAEPGDAT